MRDPLIIVCAACRTAACWHGEILCQESRHANTTQVRRSKLDQEGRESPGNYSDSKIKAVMGDGNPGEVASDLPSYPTGD